MKKSFLYIIALFLFSFSLKSEDKKIITGDFNWNQWKVESGWKKIDSSIYLPKLDIINQTKSIVLSDKILFEVFAGSWCGDSESELPKIIKILESMDYRIETLKIYGVDRDKDMPNHFAKFKNIEKVPTLIINKNGNEIGRIIEFPENPEKNWEIEILKIIQ
jgi:thiol-disulfide isomerase/thioredoxin